MNLIWPKQNWMTVFASLLYQLFASNVNEIGVWSLQGKPLASAWLKETVLKNDLDGQGRIKVDERLRVKGRNNIFAIGDVTDIPKENDWDSLIELAVIHFGALVNGINPSYLVYHVGYTKLYLRAGQIDALGNKKKQVLQGILEIQKCFRGHQARGYFCELKNEMTTLQSCTASWLVTRDASHLNRSKTYPENAKPRRKSFMEIIPEVKDLSKEPVQNLVSALAGLQRRVDKADAIVEQKEEEKAIIDHRESLALHELPDSKELRAIRRVVHVHRWVDRMEERRRGLRCFNVNVFTENRQEGLGEGKDNTKGFLQQTREKVKGATQGATETVKKTLGLGQHDEDNRKNY
ncbi:hypothetical protein JHK86_052092 [Glycine max]|nr:hypothetical protein JHK86_052092 [Glycine max]